MTHLYCQAWLSRGISKHKVVYYRKCVWAQDVKTAEYMSSCLNMQIWLQTNAIKTSSLKGKRIASKQQIKGTLLFLEVNDSGYGKTNYLP